MPPASTIKRPVDPPASGTPRQWAAPAGMRCGYTANALMLRIASRFLFLGYLLVWLAAIYFFIAAPTSRRASIRYLDRIHGRKRNPFARRWHAYRHMVTFGYLLLDRALMLARPDHGFAISCDGLEHLRAAAGAGRQQTGLILLTAHFGMAEIAAPYLRRMGLNRSINIVMYQDTRDATEQFHVRHRHMLQHVNVISTTDPLDAGLKIIAALRKGEVVALRADRTLAGKGVAVTLLNERLLIPAGPFLAATLSAAPVLYVYTCRTGYRRYRCTITAAAPISRDLPRDQQVAAAAQAFASHLESTLRENPYQWSNFYDLWQIQRVPDQT